VLTVREREKKRMGLSPLGKKKKKKKRGSLPQGQKGRELTLTQGRGEEGEEPVFRQRGEERTVFSFKKKKKKKRPKPPMSAKGDGKRKRRENTNKQNNFFFLKKKKKKRSSLHFLTPRGGSTFR